MRILSTQVQAGGCPSWVIRDRLEPAASPAMSAVPPKAEEVRYGATCQRTMGPTRLATIASCAGVSVFRSRRAADRRQPRRAVLSCGAGIRIRDGHRLSRRAPAAVPHHRLCACGDRRFRRVTQACERELVRYELTRDRIDAGLSSFISIRGNTRPGIDWEGAKPA